MEENQPNSSLPEGTGPVGTLWTKDFTILTLGSVVSMVGSTLSGFAMNLMVLDYTGSPFLYAIYIAVYILPQMVMPIFSGAILDRFSRLKTIYGLDFFTAGLYAVAAAALYNGFFNFGVFAVFTFLLGAINGVYTVAYQSFYPLLITPGNYSKAYSVAGLMENLTFFMVPLSALVYNTIGIVALFAVDAVSYLVAAIMETRITAEEHYIALQKERGEHEPKRSHGKRLLDDIKEGFQYLVGERGLLAVAVYFAASALCSGGDSALVLPYFESAFPKGLGFLPEGEYVFMVVQGCAILGRSIGAAVHYRVKLPTRWKYAIALGVYITISVICGTYLFLPLPVMMVLMLFHGLLGVTSYTIRISATQSYVPDEKKGRFNGAFNMLSTVGSFAGTLLAGTLSNVMPVRSVILLFNGVSLLVAILVIGGNKKHIAPIYNRQQ